MGNQQSSAKSPVISLKIGFDTQLQIWRVIFYVNSIGFDNPFDVIYFPFGQCPVGLEIIQHSCLREVKKLVITCEDGSVSLRWIYMDDENPQSFQVLPVARTGRRLRNHPSKFYICDRIDETTTWVITIFEVRDCDGNLAIPLQENEYTMFSAGCRITERSIIDTGSTRIPELEYDAVSNEIQPIQVIDFETIYAAINHCLRPPIIQTMQPQMNS